MRNWKVNKFCKYYKGGKSFYPTYEELKVIIAFNISLSILCFYPTYEELKD